MVRVCPERDAECPHGMACPYARDRYTCDPAYMAGVRSAQRSAEAFRSALQRSAEPTDADAEGGVTSGPAPEAI